MLASDDWDLMSLATRTVSSPRILPKASTMLKSSPAVHHDRVLISRRAARPERDNTVGACLFLAELQVPSRVRARGDLALVILLDESRSGARQVPADFKIIGTHHNAVHGVVDKESDGLARKRFELEDGNRFVGGPVRVVAQVPFARPGNAPGG